MWNGVTARFTQFAENLELTGDQISDGITKHRGVTKCLNSNYYNSSSETDHSMLVGSWGKHTRMRPPRDIDLLYALPVDVYQRFEKYAGNGAVRKVVGIRRGAISDNMRVSFQTARSIG